MSNIIKNLLLILSKKLAILITIFLSEFFFIVRKILTEVKKTVRIRNSKFKTESLKSNSQTHT